MDRKEFLSQNWEDIPDEQKERGVAEFILGWDWMLAQGWDRLDIWDPLSMSEDDYLVLEYVRKEWSIFRRTFFNRKLAKIWIERMASEDMPDTDYMPYHVGDYAHSAFLACERDDTEEEKS